jgi:hypothetical protein
MEMRCDAQRFVTKVNHALPLQLVGLMALLVVMGFGGCATTWQPITDTQRVALMPSKGEITMAARPGKPIGEMIPVDVAVANGTEEPYRIEPDQVFAINVQGQRIAPIPADQAITAASHANALKAGLVGAAKHALGDGIAGAAAGAAVGATVGTIVASPAQGALLGAAMGCSVGAGRWWNLWRSPRPGGGSQRCRESNLFTVITNTRRESQLFR